MKGSIGSIAPLGNANGFAQVNYGFLLCFIRTEISFVFCKLHNRNLSPFINVFLLRRLFRTASH